MKRTLHRLAHLLGWNYGEPVFWYLNDELMSGFKCDGCGRVGSVVKV
jgi:hypothetical protein